MRCDAYLEYGEESAEWKGELLRFHRSQHQRNLNQRGHGKSGWSTDGAYSIDDHFTDIARFIETLDLKDIILIGHSMGGRNALFYTACIPDRIKKLILVDARPGNSDKSITALRNLLDSFSFETEDLDDFLQKAQALYPHLPLKASFELIYSSRKRAFPYRSSFQYDPWMIIASHLAEYMVEDLWPFMESIPCPTLIIRGEHSRFISQEEAERMGRLIPEAKIVVIPRTSHIPMIENPTVFKKAVHSFIS